MDTTPSSVRRFLTRSHVGMQLSVPSLAAAPALPNAEDGWKTEENDGASCKKERGAKIMGGGAGMRERTALADLTNDASTSPAISRICQNRGYLSPFWTPALCRANEYYSEAIKMKFSSDKLNAASLFNREEEEDFNPWNSTVKPQGTEGGDCSPSISATTGTPGKSYGMEFFSLREMVGDEEEDMSRWSMLVNISSPLGGGDDLQDEIIISKSSSSLCSSLEYLVEKPIIGQEEPIDSGDEDDYHSSSSGNDTDYYSDYDDDDDSEVEEYCSDYSYDGMEWGEDEDEDDEEELCRGLEGVMRVEYR